MEDCQSCVLVFIFLNTQKSIITANKLSGSTAESMCALLVKVYTQMSLYTVFALLPTQVTIELKYIFLSVLILPLVCNIQLRMINKHPICSHIK